MIWKAVAFDLDDTLLRDDRTISAKTLTILRRLAVEGVAILPVSGRTHLSMKPYVDLLGCAVCSIACNGAEVWREETLLKSETFSTELAREIAAFGQECNCYTQTYDSALFYYNEHSPWASFYASVSSLKGVYVGDLTVFIQEPRKKLLMVAEEEKIARMLVEARRRFAGRASVTCSKPNYLEFNPPQATKGIALKWAAEYLGFTIQDVIAFGDSLNDLPMLQAAGFSVAVGNARPEVKQACKAVCGTNQDDGVAQYLRGLL